MIRKMLDPYKVFISLLIAIAFWITPFGVDREPIPIEERYTAIDEFSLYPKLIQAIVPEVSAACAPSCMEDVCLKWVPIGGSCQPDNPWDIGCCTRYGSQCNEELPGCGPEEPPPPPPPTYSPPTVSAALTCTTWGNSSWCINNGKVVISASDPQGFAVTLSGNITVNGSNTPYSCANPCSLTMPSGSGTVTYTATAATSGLSSGTGSIAFYFDPGDPVITSSTSGAQSGSWHTSAGAIVTVVSSDAISGLASVSITRNGTAVTSPFSLVDGTHNISVIATDVAGNQSSSSFTVKVDSLKPVISFNTTGLLNGAWYRSATVAVSATDATSGLQTLLITDNGSAKSSPIALSDGPHVIFATATDNAGNVQSGSTNIQVDGSPPSIVSSITGTAGNAGWWVSPVNINAAFSDALSGVATQLFSPNAGTTWMALPSSISTDGIHQVVFRSSDNAGNSAEINNTVKVDKSAPVLSVSPTGTLGDNGWYVSNVQMSAAASDATSGLALFKYILDGVWKTYTSPFILGNGIHTVQFQGLDNAGNDTTTSLQTFQVDTTDPVITPTVSGTSGSNGWYISNTQVSASATDAGSGTTPLKVSVDGNAWQNYSAPITLSDGLHTVQFQVTDIAGNSTTTNTALKIDTTTPQMLGNLTGTAGDNSWYVSGVTVQAANTDVTSGIASEKYRVDGGAWQTGTSIPVSADGLHTVDFLAIDNAGNQKTISQIFKIDQTPPQITLTPSGDSGSNGWYVSNVSLEMLSNDTTSGLSSSEYDLDETGWKSLLNSITLTDGRRSILVRSKDKAGNSATASILIKVDTVPPVHILVLDGIAGSNDWYISDVLADVSTSDATSANVITTITNNGGDASFDPITLTEGIHTLHYTAVDEAGNSVSASDVVSVDTTIPTNILSSPSPNSVAIDTVQVGGQSADLTSGLSTNQISFDNVTWLSLPSAIPDWSYDWETADLPNGSLSIFARSIDLAGNTGTPSQIKVVLDNHPPFLELSNSWNVWESGILSVEPNVTPLESVTILIKDPLMRYPNEVFFKDDIAPREITWDRVIGNVTASPGSYLVEVEVCDIYGVCSKATATIIVPEGDLIPTAEPFVFLPRINQPPVIAPTQIVIPTQLPQAVAIPPQLEPVVVPLQPLWTAALVTMFLFKFAVLLLLDPRPTALRSLAKTIQGVINHDR